jgi:hypothetical protein
MPQAVSPPTCLNNSTELSPCLSCPALLVGRSDLEAVIVLGLASEWPGKSVPDILRLHDMDSMNNALVQGKLIKIVVHHSFSCHL